MPLYRHVCIVCNYKFVGYLQHVDSYPMSCPKGEGDCMRSDKARTLKDLDGGLDKYGPPRFIMPPNCS